MNKEKAARYKLEGIVLCYMLLTRLEELQRMNNFVRKDKQIINRTIKHLKKKEELFHKLDDAVGIDTVDEVVQVFEEYMDKISKVPFEYMKTVSKGIEEDVLK